VLHPLTKEPKMRKTILATASALAISIVPALAAAVKCQEHQSTD
jgi:hypothetical protein